MNAVFVTGTDTAVGKTVICGLLGRYLLNKGHRVITQKWIQTGSTRFSDDVDAHLKLMKLKRADIKKYMPDICPYSFKYPSSPHLAAKLEGKKISHEKIGKSFLALSKQFDYVIVEGLGGALVPFNEKRLVIDIAAKLNLPVLIVAGNKLGAINHTLLTIEAIESRNVRVLGIVFNCQSNNESETIIKDNVRIIKKFTSEKILGSLPWSKDKNSLHKAFVPIGNKILTELTGKR